MSRTARLAAVLLALALPQAVVASWLLASAEPKTFSLDAVPSELRGYSAVAEQPLDADVLALLGPDAYLQRLYAAADGDPVWLYVGLYGEGGAKGAHDPNECYPAQGWEVTGQRDVIIEMPGGERLNARMLVAMRDGQSQLVLYWFQAAHRWPGVALSEQLLRIYDTLTGTPQYAFVRLSAHFTGEESPEEAMRDLAAQLAPHIRRAVDFPG